MKLEENLKDSYNYTIKLFKDIGRLIILIILNIIPIVDFIVLGYFARVIKESPSTQEPPPLEKYGDLWISGAKLFVASLVYMIVPLGLIIAGYASSIVGAFMPTPGLGILGTTMIIIGLILAFLIMIIAVMAIVHMAKTGKIGDAFDFGKILSIIKNVGWTNYIVWILIIFVIGLILSGVSLIPVVGFILALIISPILTVFVGRSASIVYESGTSAPGTYTPPTATTLFCGYCGNPIKPEDKFCGKCGRPVK